MCGKKAADKQTLESLRQALNSDPTNLDAANRYWTALASFQCGGDVIEAYRRVALVSQEGVIALARAYRELFESSGEGPRAAYFDSDLLQALRSRLPELPEGDRRTVEWLLQSIR
jgi:hypothetical protein